LCPAEIYSSLLPEQVGSSGNALDLYSRSTQFESRSEHLRLTWFSSVPAGKFWGMKECHCHFLSYSSLLVTNHPAVLSCNMPSLGTEQVTVAVTPQTCIWRCSVQVSAGSLAILNDDFHGFLQAFEADSGKVRVRFPMRSLDFFQLT
jgi:hypothetical protein